MREMADQLSMELVRKGLCCDHVVLDVSYDVENLKDPKKASQYQGQVERDRYGRETPKGVHGSQNLSRYTSSSARIMDAVASIYDRIVDNRLFVRRFNVAVMHLLPREEIKNDEVPEQLDLFTDYEALEKEKQAEEAALDREHRMQKALLDIRDRFGKNSIIKGLNLQEGATALERNNQVGGHRAGE